MSARVLISPDSASFCRGPRETPACARRPCAVRGLWSRRATRWSARPCSSLTTKNFSTAAGPDRDRDLDRVRRTSLLDHLALVVDHARAHGPCLAGHDDVAAVERAFLHEHRRHRATALGQLGLDDHTLGAGRSETALSSSSRTAARRTRAAPGCPCPVLADTSTNWAVTAPLFGHQAELGELLAHAWGRRPLVDLVDRHHDGHTGRLRVVDGFRGLRHDAVVGRDHQDDDVGDLGAASTHGRKGRVTRGVEEHDVALGAVDHDRHLVGADVLGDAAGLTGGDARLADVVEQRGLAVVDVAHDRHDRGPRKRPRRSVSTVFGM
jgi:hypothetical protein